MAIRVSELKYKPPLKRKQSFETFLKNILFVAFVATFALPLLVIHFIQTR